MTDDRAHPFESVPDADGDPEFASLDGEHELAYTEYGAADGVPVLFLHGTPGSRLLGALFHERAANAGVRLLAFDRPGFGRSPPVQDATDLTDGACVAAVLDAVDADTAGLIAFSGSSRYALGAVAERADRISEVHIVSGATPPSVSEETPTLQRSFFRIAATAPVVIRCLFRGQTWLARRRDPSFVLSQYTTGDPRKAVPDDDAAIVKADFLEALANSRRGLVSEFREVGTPWDVDFDAIDTEVQFWHGEDDSNVPIGDARHFASALPSSRMHAVEGADHLQTLVDSVPTVLNQF